MKRKIKAVLLSLLMVVGGGGVAVATAAPASAATYSVSGCHYHTGWITPYSNYKMQYCYRTYNTSYWSQQAYNGWYARDCDPYCTTHWMKTSHKSHWY